MSFFNVGALGGNPFSTLVGQKIEKATDGGLEAEDWSLNMEICDLVNASAENARDAVKAIRKRLQQSTTKNYTVVLYTLTVLETCVKNCGRPLHVQVCAKDFIQDLVKLIGPKNDPPPVVQERVLSLIQSWADAFQNQPELSGVVSVYSELRNKGIEFPAPDVDTAAPIHTPHRSVHEDEPALSHSPRQPAPMHQPQTSSDLSPSQIAKLQSELQMVTENMSVLGEMLTELRPGQEHPADLQLLQELHSTCRSMQTRIVDLISKLSNDEITAELLRINDEMNNLFLRYSRFEKNRGITSPSQVLGKAMGVPQTTNSGEPDKTDIGPDSLIDLSEVASGGSDIDTKFSNLKIDKKPVATSQQGIDEFDMFAQSRNISSEGSTSAMKEGHGLDLLSNTHKNVPPTIPQAGQLPRDSEFDEIAAWLDEKVEDKAQVPEDSITSSEFDKFLAERAAVAETLPNIPPTTQSNQSNNESKR
ncbi:TOM1-like protein 2 [Ctenocephalides felis]|uniref:TOM1-like protein 2 n=1 Tax=Ctenocephalides felis TaxID=7515 RepID=UPI000E6E279F|nr:TOM1-like protein 2 [Ctenocephalides felis]